MPCFSHALRPLHDLLKHNFIDKCPDGGPRTIHSGTTPTPFSTTPSHGCMKSLTHTPHSRCASQRFAKVCLRYTQTSSLSLPRLTSAIHSSLHSCAACSSTHLYDSREPLHPSLAQFNLHNSRVRRASGFLLTAFSNATPHTFFQPRALIPASRPKKH